MLHQDGFIPSVFLPCRVSLEVFTAFFIFDLALSRNSSDGSGERKEKGVNYQRGVS